MYRTYGAPDNFGAMCTQGSRPGLGVCRAYGAVRCAWRSAKPFYEAEPEECVAPTALVNFRALCTRASALG